MSVSDLMAADGHLAVLAIDHRDSLRALLRPDDPASLTRDAIVELKLDLVRGLADLASGVMLEPEYSIPEVVDAGVLAPGVGFTAALEAQGYLSDPEAAPTRILDGWSVEAAKACGAAAAKLLVPYHPDRPFAAAQERAAREVLDRCDQVGLALVLEPLFYGLDSPEDRTRVVVETARRFAAMRPALLKLPYPGTRAACEEVTAIAPLPWAMLSAGGSFEHVLGTYEEAAAGGCAGFMVGRALWAEAAHAPPAERAGVIAEVVRPRFERLLAVTASPHAGEAHAG